LPNESEPGEAEGVRPHQISGHARRRRRIVLSRLIRSYDTIGRLFSTLIEKALLERQSQAFERIILSHENISQWKEFVQHILRELRFDYVKIDGVFLYKILSSKVERALACNLSQFMSGYRYSHRSRIRRV
jgi:hypothetical protein